MELIEKMSKYHVIARRMEEVVSTISLIDDLFMRDRIGPETHIQERERALLRFRELEGELEELLKETSNEDSRSV